MTTHLATQALHHAMAETKQLAEQLRYLHRHSLQLADHPLGLALIRYLGTQADQAQQLHDTLLADSLLVSVGHPDLPDRQATTTEHTKEPKP